MNESKTRFFRRAVDFIDAGDAAGCALILSSIPAVHSTSRSKAGTTFHNPTLLQSSPRIRYATASCQPTLST